MSQLEEENNKYKELQPPYFKKLQEFPKIDQVPETEIIDFIGHYGPIKKIILKNQNLLLTIKH